MRCFTSLVLGLLALEVVLARNLQKQGFSAVQSMCSDSFSEEQECMNNCQTKEGCTQNAMCCTSSCGSSCKTVNTAVPKAGQCPWSLLQALTVGMCPKKVRCFSDSDCSGNMKCCNVGCIMQCAPPVPEISLQ